MIRGVRREMGGCGAEVSSSGAHFLREVGMCSRARYYSDAVGLAYGLICI